MYDDQIEADKQEVLRESKTWKKMEKTHAKSLLKSNVILESELSRKIFRCMQADAAHTTRVKLRKGVEAAGGRIIENDRYVSGDYAEEIYCDKRRANRS